MVLSGGEATNPWAWSGIPHGLANGLRSHGLPVTRVSADLPRPCERVGRAVARRIPGHTVIGEDAPWLITARDLRLRTRRELAAADVAIALGSHFGDRIGNNHVRVTFEDMTVAQTPYPPGAARNRWVKRQREIYARADLCCAATPWAAESIIADYGVPESKVLVAGFGANVACEPVPKDWEQPRLLWVGVDWHRKGGDLLTDAFQQAAIPNAILDLVGQHPQIDIPNVRCHGLIRDVSRLRSFFENATLFVLPSRFDAAGIVLLEAASAGTPCIGSAIAGVPYNVGEAGITIPVGDLDALTAALIDMTRPEIAAAYRDAAIRQAPQRTWHAVAQRIIDRVASG